MTRITNVDQVLMLLRQQLQNMSKSGRSRPVGKTGAQQAQRHEKAAGRIEAVARTDDLSEEDLARTLVGALLVDEFGEAAANDPKFQKLVDDVYRIIVSDVKARELLGDAMQQIDSNR